MEPTKRKNNPPVKMTNDPSKPSRIHLIMKKIKIGILRITKTLPTTDRAFFIVVVPICIVLTFILSSTITL